MPAAVRRSGRRPSDRLRGPARRWRGSSKRSPDARAKPARGQAIVKLNEASRAGATRSSTCGPARPGAAESGRALAGAVQAMGFEHADPRLDWTSRSSGHDGGIVEERIVGAELRSPSVQLRVTPLGEVELLSTHDQLLGGPTGQTYLGLPLPRRLRLRARDQPGGRQDRRRLAAKGCSAASRWTSSWCATGTALGRRTRSSSTCARAVRPIRSSRCSSSPTASYDQDTALFVAPSGREKTSSPATMPGRLFAASRRTISSTSWCGTAALRPGAPDRRRLPHDGGAGRAW